MNYRAGTKIDFLALTLAECGLGQYSKAPAQNDSAVAL